MGDYHFRVGRPKSSHWLLVNPISGPGDKCHIQIISLLDCDVLLVRVVCDCRIQTIVLLTLP